MTGSCHHLRLPHLSSLVCEPFGRGVAPELQFEVGAGIECPGEIDVGKTPLYVYRLV